MDTSELAARVRSLSATKRETVYRDFLAPYMDGEDEVLDLTMVDAGTLTRLSEYVTRNSRAWCTDVKKKKAKPAEKTTNPFLDVEEDVDAFFAEYGVGVVEKKEEAHFPSPVVEEEKEEEHSPFPVVEEETKEEVWKADDDDPLLAPPPPRPANVYCYYLDAEGILREEGGETKKTPPRRPPPPPSPLRRSKKPRWRYGPCVTKSGPLEDGESEYISD